LVSRLSVTERLRDSLKRTRERFGFAAAEEEPDWDALEEALILADVGIPTTQEILEGVRSGRGDYGSRLRNELLSVLREPMKPEETASDAPRVTLVVGVNGVGKTTTVAKLAHHFAQQGRNVVIVAADTFRAAAQEQLAMWAERVGVDIVSGESGRDPASVVHDGLEVALAKGADEVIVDTAGRLHTKRPLMDELGKVERVAGRVIRDAPHATLLVMDATVGTNGLAQAREFAEALRVTGIVLTKMDGTAKGGVVLAIARELGLSVRYTGVGEGLDDLLEFSPEAFVEALLSRD
jgi:fused signal recognition particle receptor